MSFLVENKENWIPEYDLELIRASDQTDIFVDSILKIFDQITEDGTESMPDLVNVDNIPEELLQHLSSLVAWRQTDYEFNFLTFRELVKNIVRIYKIKGRPLSYETFFRAVGYIPKLTEMWWNKDSQLVGEKPIGAPNPNLPTNVLNKSNFLQIELDLAFNDPAFPEPLTDGEFILIIFEYLNFLKPIHIKYLPILVNVPEFLEDVVTLENTIPTIILGDFNTPLGIGVDGLFEDQLEGQLIDEFLIFNFFKHEDCALPYYNGRLRYSTSVARVVEFNNVQFPASVIERQNFSYGDACSPIPDKLNIIVRKDHEIKEEKFELRYNGYTYYNGQTSFATDKRVEIDDSFDFDSTDLGFGFGNVWEQTGTSGEIDPNNEQGFW